MYWYVWTQTVAINPELSKAYTANQQAQTEPTSSYHYPIEPPIVLDAIVVLHEYSQVQCAYGQ